MTRVLVTGMGVVSSLGLGREAFWRAIVEGRTGFSTIESFETDQLDRSIAGEVKGFRARDFLTHAESRRMGRCSAFSVAAARMAVEDAGLQPEQLAGAQTSVIVGTTMGERLVQICTGEARVPSRIGRVPPGFDAWFARGVRKAPGDRWSSALQMADALSAVLGA